jgi:hypothetical protein
MAEHFEVPEKRCKKGHIIPLNGAARGREVIQTSHLICEQCAIEASFGETLEGIRHRPVKGKKLEKLGQESFLGSTPSIFVK